jgi:hypothetical protein
MIQASINNKVIRSNNSATRERWYNYLMKFLPMTYGTANFPIG